jgi:hypothetical protein
MLQILFTFYRRFLPVTITILLLFCFFIESPVRISHVVTLFRAKIIFNILIGALFIVFSKEATIFYNNLGYGASKMYWGVMLVDLFLWLIVTLPIILR